MDPRDIQHYNTQHNDTQHNDTQHNIKSHMALNGTPYKELSRQVSFILSLTNKTFMLSVVMLGVVMLRVVMLIVMAPASKPYYVSSKRHLVSIYKTKQKTFFSSSLTTLSK
jgi:hypothetical protein